MFILVTHSRGDHILVNLNQVTFIESDKKGSAIFFEEEISIVVKESLEELYDRIRSMSNGK